MALSREQVFQTADALAEQGKRVSVRGVRHALGGGSPNEITEYLRIWRETHEEQQREFQALEEMSPEIRQSLTEPMETLLARIWSTLRAATKAEVEGMKSAFNIQAAALRDEAQDQTDLAEDLSKELEQVNQTLAEEQTRREEAEGKVQSLQHEATVAEIHLQELQKQMSAVSQERDQVREEAKAALANASKLQGHLEAEKERRQEVEQALRAKN
jgi:chromosome segregation ATPase